MKNYKKFAVDLKNHSDAPARALMVRGNYIEVNHRGDLLIHENDIKIVCAVRSGGWFSVREVEEEVESSKTGEV